MPETKRLKPSALHPATAPAAPPPDYGRSPAYAAQILGVSRAMVGKILATGELPAFKIGRRIVVRDSAIAAFMEARRLR